LSPTETSTLTFIGIPAQAYTGNMTFLQLALGYVIGRILVSALFIPAYFRGDLFTSYELLQRRFGTRVKTLSAVIFLITAPCRTASGFHDGAGRSPSSRRCR
jgi:Na+/proline symporter